MADKVNAVAVVGDFGDDEPIVSTRPPVQSSGNQKEWPVQHLVWSVLDRDGNSKYLVKWADTGRKVWTELNWEPASNLACTDKVRTLEQHLAAFEQWLTSLGPLDLEKFDRLVKHSILEYSKADQEEAPSKQTGLDIDLLEIAVEHLIKWLDLTPEERGERMHDRLGLYFLFNFKQWIDHLSGRRGDGREKNDFLQTVTIYSMELARYVKQLEVGNIED